MTPADIIDKCGGDIEVAAALKIHSTTVNGWRRRGIPEERWTELIKLGRGLTPAILHRANEELRNADTRDA